MQADQPYVPLTDDNFYEMVVNNSQPVLVVFTTAWSGACHIIDPILKGLAAEYEDRIRIYKINADKNRKTIHTYGVYELPTILFFKNGQIIDHIIGIISKNNLIAKIEGILDSAACIDSGFNTRPPGNGRCRHAVRCHRPISGDYSPP